MDDYEIAERLNQDGLTTPEGMSFTYVGVRWIRYKHAISALTSETVKASLSLKPPARWAYPPEKSIMVYLRERSPSKSSIPGGLGKY